MGQDKDMCIYEVGECINDYNCSMCPIKTRFYKDLKAKKKKHKILPSEWDAIEVQK